MDDFLVRSVVLGVLLPAVVSGVITLLGRRTLGTWASTLGISLGFIAGYIGVQGLPSIPLTVTELLPVVAGVALIWVWFERFWHSTGWLTWLLRLLPLAALGVFLRQRLFIGQITSRFGAWTPSETAFNIAIPLITVALLWIFIAVNGATTSSSAEADADAAPKRHTAILPTALVLLCTGSAVSLVAAGSAIMAQLMGVLTATIGAVMVLAWLWPGAYLGASSAAVIALVLGSGVALGGFFAATLPWYAA
ncbi:MAG: hypothetical protein AAF708_12760, partial [Deinococcota bacterium]